MSWENLLYGIGMVMIGAALYLHYADYQRLNRKAEKSQELMDVLAYTVVQVHEGHQVDFIEECPESVCMYIQMFVRPVRDSTGELHGSDSDLPDKEDR